MGYRCTLTLVLCLACSGAFCSEEEGVLDAQEYVDQVFKNNEDFIASQQMEQDYATLSRQGSLLFSPRLISSASNLFKQDPQLIPTFPFFLGASTLYNQEYVVGVEQETHFGLQWRLNSNSSFFKLKTTTPSTPSTPFSDPADLLPGSSGLLPIGNSQNWSVTQSLSIKQPLWKNGFGQKTRAQARQAQHAALARSHEEAFKLKNATIQAESIYWQLVLARAFTQLRAESLVQAQELLEFAEKKREESLVLESDLYQARSVYSVNQLEYQRAKDAEIAAALAFNALRAISSAEVPETLLPLSEELLDLITPEERVERRDLLAREEALKSQEASDIISINDLLPDLDLTASVGFTGNNIHFRDSFDQSFTHPSKSAAVMIKLTFPLSPYKIRDVKRAYRNNSRSARLSLERAKFQHDQLWDELQARLEEQKKLLKLLADNVAMQKKKLENVQEEYGRGLSTFFAVTGAQSDYQGAKIAILQTFRVALEILLQMSMYE